MTHFRQNWLTNWLLVKLRATCPINRTYCRILVQPLAQWWRWWGVTNPIEDNRIYIIKVWPFSSMKLHYCSTWASTTGRLAASLTTKILYYIHRFIICIYEQYNHNGEQYFCTVFIVFRKSLKRRKKSTHANKLTWKR